MKCYAIDFERFKIHHLHSHSCSAKNSSRFFQDIHAPQKRLITDAISITNYLIPSEKNKKIGEKNLSNFSNFFYQSQILLFQPIFFPGDPPNSSI